MLKTNIFIVLLVSLLSASPMSQAANFAEICSGNGELYTNARINNVIAMAGNDPGNPKALYINATGIDTSGHRRDIYAVKGLENANTAEVFLTNAVVLAYLTQGNIELCVTGDASRLYGVSVKN